MSKQADEKLLEQYTTKDQGLVARYLQVKKFDMKEISIDFPCYKEALFSKAITEVCKNYDETVSFDIGRSGVCPASYKHLEVGRDKFEELLTCGYRVLRSEKTLVINNYMSWGTLYLNVSYSKENSEEAIGFLNKVVKYMTDNNFYIGESIDLTGKFLKVQDLNFESVVLPEVSKKAIKVGALEFFNKKAVYSKNKIPFKRGLIFTGVPGTGKTLTGKVLMKESDATFLWVTAGDLGDKYTEASKTAKNLFNMAKELSPCILFIEDVDDFLEKNGAIDAVKTQMDGIDGLDGIVTILCTNFPEKLPLALVDRPSRFDDVIVFSLPDLDLRLGILNQVSEDMEIVNRDVILKELASKTKGLTGSHLKEILVYALLLSTDENRETILEKDLNQALKKVLDTKETITNGLSEVNVKVLIKELKKIKDNNNE
jgi:SpoVK/Ycf46/Vps4 family AAA+-type ATPase